MRRKMYEQYNEDFGSCFFRGFIFAMIGALIFWASVFCVMAVAL